MSVRAQRLVTTTTEDNMTRDEALERARHLAGACGPGYEPRVWDNLSWHYAAERRRGNLRINVHEYGPVVFTAFASTRGSVDGEWTATSDTPAKAIRGVVEQVRARRDTLTAFVDAMGARPSTEQGERPFAVRYDLSECGAASAAPRDASRKAGGGE